MPLTPNLSLDLPTPDGDPDTWDDKLNAALTELDAYVFTTRGTADAALPKAGGDITGPVTATDLTLSGALTVSGTINGSVSGNAGTATALATSRNFSLSGPVTASVQGFDGTGNVVLTTAIADGALTIAKTNGLQAALNGKQATLDANQIRPTTVSTAEPAGGSDGDIHIQHTA